MNNKDLTRWNRAGLKEFRYIDGNAITYLETLRQALSKEYNPGSEPQWQELISRFPELLNESAFQKTKRISDQYYDERRDFAWEILRSFSRSVHVLGEYINAYANEAYLPTAVEWDNIRKLVALLGYQPSPPASAMTYIALLYKSEQKGKVNKGFAVKNKPAKGASTIIFETQETLEGQASINTLRLKDWNKNKRTLIIKNKKIAFELSQLVQDINVGDVGVLVNETTGYLVMVESVNSNQNRSILTLQAQQDIPNNLALCDTTLYLQPAFIAKPLPNGAGSVTLDQVVNLSAGDTVFVGKNNNFVAKKISEISLDKLHFKQVDNSSNNDIIRPQLTKRQTIKDFPEKGDAFSAFFILNNISDVENVFMVDGNQNPVTSQIHTSSGGTNTLYVQGNSVIGNELFFIQKPANSETLATITSVGNNVVTSLQFPGKASELASNQWAWVQHKNDTQAAYKISKITQEENQFSVRLVHPATGVISKKSVKSMQSGYKQALKHRDFDINNKPAWSKRSTTAATVFELQDAKLLKQLKREQKLICYSAGKSFSVKIKKIESPLLHVTPPFHLDYQTATKASVFTRNNTLIYGNVVSASHGETQPQQILGNGDASQTQQKFKLQSDNISWISDPNFNTGVRADIMLIVGSRYWQQVENLSNSGGEDHHYQIKVDEDNKLSIHFGDGRHGRKLPTGIDNIRVIFREGTGETGNLAANALVKIARPDPLVDDFIAPLTATGGASKEAPEHMRENAPAALLTLNRAVSLSDFEHLARHHSMVWQARAFEKIPDRPAPVLIEVVIVAAGGSPFTTNSEIAQLLKTFFLGHAIPNLPISVISYQPLVMQIKPSIMVDESAFDKDLVAKAVIQHLQTSLALKQRQLGQALFRSRIIALIEQVTGVENANCEIIGAFLPTTKAPSQSQTFKGADGEIRKIAIKPQQLLYLDTELFPIDISSQTFEI